MIQTKDLTSILNKNKISFFTGVPDSVLKNFTANFDKFGKNKHIIAVNEGSAVSLGIGYHLSSKKMPCVYLQNSGLGNAINPLSSIAHKKVYSVPMLLIIGWRGAKNKTDEPQHLTKGRITPSLLKLLDINFCILRKKEDLKKLDKLIKYSKNKHSPVACLIEKGTLEKGKVESNKNSQNKKFEKRKDFISEFLKHVPKNSKIISTTGYTSRELMQIREEKKNYTRAKIFTWLGGWVMRLWSA